MLWWIASRWNVAFHEWCVEARDWQIWAAQLTQQALAICWLRPSATTISWIHRHAHLRLLVTWHQKWPFKVEYVFFSTEADPHGVQDFRWVDRADYLAPLFAHKHWSRPDQSSTQASPWLLGDVGEASSQSSVCTWIQRVVSKKDIISCHIISYHIISYHIYNYKYVYLYQTVSDTQMSNPC